MAGPEIEILTRPDGSVYGAYGDIRDRLVGLPHNPWGSTAGTYVESDLFVVKHRVLAELVPDARSVFEIGALYGHFLVTALDACPNIDWVGWVDDESHTAGSNALCAQNLIAACGGGESFPDDGCVFLNGLGEANWSTRIGDARSLYDHDLGVDVVHVDGYHSYAAALIDITLAWSMMPRLILVDDTIAIDEVRAAVDVFCSHAGLEPEWHETVNGFAVIQP